MVIAIGVRCFTVAPKFFTMATCEFALVTTACGSSSSHDVASAIALAHSARRRRYVPLARVHCEPWHYSHSLSPRQRARLASAYDEVRDLTSLVNLTTALLPIAQPTEGLLWPIRGLNFSALRKHQSTKGDRLRSTGYVLPPSDHGCSVLKLHAWSLVDYSAVLLAEPDTTLLENPDTFMRRHAATTAFAGRYRNLSEGLPSSRGAGSDGLYSSLMLLRPNKLLHRILMDKARFAWYQPRTNTAIDVIESMMPLQDYPSWPALPRHTLGSLDKIEHVIGVQDLGWERSVADRMRRMASQFSVQKAPVGSGWCATGTTAATQGFMVEGKIKAHAVCCHRQCGICVADGCHNGVVCAGAVIGCEASKHYCCTNGIVHYRKRVKKRTPFCRGPNDVGCLLSAAQLAQRPGLLFLPGHPPQPSKGRMVGRRLDGYEQKGARCRPGREPSHPQKPERYALVISLCNTSDFYGGDGTAQLDRAIKLKRSLQVVGSAIETIAFAHGFAADGVARLADNGWQVRDVSGMVLSKLLRPILEPETGRHFPRRGRVQPRADGGCTALKFMAWNLTEYTRVFHSDTDVCMQQDPLPWAQVHTKLGTYFPSCPARE